MKQLFLVCVAAAAVALPASAQSVKSEVTASNGVVVTVYSDEFAERYEYTAPAIQFDDGFALVAKVSTADNPGKVGVQGVFSYSGDWRYYSSAVFRGGAAVDYDEGSRDVGRCRSSRYGAGCSLTEEFYINLTPEEIATHAREGIIEVQARATRTSDTSLMRIPVAHIEAVQEVSASRPAD